MKQYVSLDILPTKAASVSAEILGQGNTKRQRNLSRCYAYVLQEMPEVSTNQPVKSLAA